MQRLWNYVTSITQKRRNGKSYTLPGTCCTAGTRSERWLRLVSSVHRAGNLRVTHDSLQKFWMCFFRVPGFAGQARDDRLTLCKDERRAKVFGITGVRVPNNLDSSTKNPPNPRSRGTSGEKFVWTLVRSVTVITTIWAGLQRKWLGKCSNLGMLVHAPRKRLTPLRLCGRHGDGAGEGQLKTHVGRIDEASWDPTYTSSWHACILHAAVDPT